MGSKHIQNFKEKFTEKGLIPLEEIKDSKQKIECIDEEGYKYLLSYRGAVSDKRTKSFNKWSKNNPFKAYNMRLYAFKVAPECKILSDDNVLMNATSEKVKFLCPECKRSYYKKWCHWIAQGKGKHTCEDCSTKRIADNKIYTESRLKEIYAEKGFILLSDYQYYLDNGKSYARMNCVGQDGFKYAINLNSLRNWKSGEDVRFSSTNPFAIKNLQKACDELNIEIKVLSFFDKKGKTWFNFQCECGNEFISLPYKVISGEKTRCNACTKKESKFERLTRLWLEENNINYIKEYRFEDCKNKRSLPFDFKIDWNNQIILIEVDGGQHFYITQWTDEEDLKEQKIKDDIKTQYCLNKGYTLLRIPYWLFNAESYKDKLKETFFG